MKLRVQRGGYMSQELAEADDITYVAIFGNDDTPVMVVEQVGRDHIQVTKANDPMFQHVLTRLGVGKAVTT